MTSKLNLVSHGEFDYILISHIKTHEHELVFMITSKKRQKPVLSFIIIG